MWHSAKISPLRVGLRVRRVVRREEVAHEGDPRRLEVAQEDDVVEVAHRVEVAEADALAVDVRAGHGGGPYPPASREPRVGAIASRTTAPGATATTPRSAATARPAGGPRASARRSAAARPRTRPRRAACPSARPVRARCRRRGARARSAPSPARAARSRAPRSPSCGSARPCRTRRSCRRPRASSPVPVAAPAERAAAARRDRYFAGWRICSVEIGARAAAARGSPGPRCRSRRRSGRPPRTGRRASAAGRAAARCPTPSSSASSSWPSELAPAAAAGRDEAGGVVEHRDGGGALDERAVRRALVVEGAGLAGSRPKCWSSSACVSSWASVISSAAVPGSPTSVIRLLAVVVVAGHLLAEDHADELAQIGVPRQQPEQHEHLPVGLPALPAGTPRRARRAPPRGPRRS